MLVRTNFVVSTCAMQYFLQAQRKITEPLLSMSAVFRYMGLTILSLASMRFTGQSCMNNTHAAWMSVRTMGYNTPLSWMLQEQLKLEISTAPSSILYGTHYVLLWQCTISNHVCLYIEKNEIRMKWTSQCVYSIEANRIFMLLLPFVIIDRSFMEHSSLSSTFQI